MLLRDLRVLHVMKTHVVVAKTSMTLSGALDLIDLYQVRGLPVVDDAGRLVGILVERDIADAVAAAGLLNHSPSSSESTPSSSKFSAIARDVGNLLVADHMTSPAVFVSEDCDLKKASVLMMESGYKRIPVLSMEGDLIGVLNRTDVIQALFEGGLSSGSAIL